MSCGEIIGKSERTFNILGFIISFAKVCTIYTSLFIQDQIYIFLKRLDQWCANYESRNYYEIRYACAHSIVVEIFLGPGVAKMYL